MKDARVGRGVDGVKNENPSQESAPKIRTLKQKVGFKALKMRTLHQKVRQKRVPLGRKSASKRQKRVPLGRKCVENAYPRAEMEVIDPPVLGQALEFWGAILNPLSLLYLSLLYLNLALPVAN